VTVHAKLLFEAVGGGCLFIVLATSLYMNYWTRRDAAGSKRQRRVHWATNVVTHDDRAVAQAEGAAAGPRGGRGRRALRPKWRGPPAAAGAGGGTGGAAANGVAGGGGASGGDGVMVGTSPPEVHV